MTLRRWQHHAQGSLQRVVLTRNHAEADGNPPGLAPAPCTHQPRQAAPLYAAVTEQGQTNASAHTRAQAEILSATEGEFYKGKQPLHPPAPSFAGRGCLVKRRRHLWFSTQRRGKRVLFGWRVFSLTVVFHLSSREFIGLLGHPRLLQTLAVLGFFSSMGRMLLGEGENSLRNRVSG